MDIEKTRELVGTAIKLFIHAHPDHGFTKDNPRFTVVEKEDFLSAIATALPECDAVHQTTEDIKKNFSDCDAALLRGKKHNQVIIVRLDSKAEVNVLLSTLHELAHIYAIEKELQAGFVFEEHCKDAPDVLPGYMLWKEFIADYLALDILYQLCPRVPVESELAQQFYRERLPTIGSDLAHSTIGSFSKLANACAMILCFDGIGDALEKGKLNMPINKRSGDGKRLQKCLVELLQKLRVQCLKEATSVIDSTFLASIGYSAIDIALYHGDYTMRHGWGG